MVKAKTIRSWNLNATNLEESVKFYRDLLGAEEGNRHQVGGVDVVRLKLGEFGIGLFDASGGERPGVPHHTISIDGPDDPEDLKRELEGKGLKVDNIRPHRDSGYSLYVNDPSGNRIELSVGDG
ncbi:MAG: VOC family protein [Chloroflexi bacterium]|nr:VOC family protein [Chloroflexota bacterium]